MAEGDCSPHAGIGFGQSKTRGLGGGAPADFGHTSTPVNMARKRIEIHPAALEELKSAAEWYLQRSEPAAEEFVAEVDRAVALVVESPRRWPIGAFLCAFLFPILFDDLCFQARRQRRPLGDFVVAPKLRELLEKPVVAILQKRICQQGHIQRSNARPLRFNRLEDAACGVHGEIEDKV